jgi:hypothetical protein
MRLIPAVAVIAVLAFASTAAAQVALAPVSFSPEFQDSLNDDLGVREGDELRETVVNAVGRALARKGATVSGNASVTIEISIIDADPNRPTMEQIRAEPGLDFGRSYSIGGAELRAVLRGSDGSVLTEVTHRRYNHSIDELLGPPATWSEARRAINQFATKVADAYVAHAS